MICLRGLKMKVELIDSAGGDLSVVNSARVSFAKEVADMDTKDVGLIRYLAKHRHDTPFRHNFIQLRCKVPLFLARQLMKHQAGLTWNEESRRYIDEVPEFYVPEKWRKRPDKSIKQGSGDGVVEYVDFGFKNLDPEPINFVYADMVNDNVACYKDMLKSGVAPEMARMVLPQSMMVNFIWSGNLLAFYHVYNLRSGNGAQEEAKVFAQLLKDAILPEFPISWQALQMRDNGTYASMENS
jgi:thymidylate synthase (FAD)